MMVQGMEKLDERRECESGLLEMVERKESGHKRVVREQGEGVGLVMDITFFGN